MLSQQYTNKVRLVFQSGYSLLELMITITILVTLATIAIPSVFHTLKNLEMKKLEVDLKGWLSAAQQEAMVYQRTVTACVADDDKVCVHDHGNHLLRFIDENNNHQYDADVEKLLTFQEVSLHFGVLITSIALNKHYIDFEPKSGKPIGYMGHIKYCPDDGNRMNAFKVSFSRTGIVKSKSDSSEATGCG